MKFARWCMSHATILLAVFSHGSAGDVFLAAAEPQGPAGKGLGLPKQYNPKLSAILFIHGMGDTKEAFVEFAKACETQGRQYGYFDYPNQGSVARSGRRLADELAETMRRNPDARFVLVCHSMGGLVARYALEVADAPSTCVTDAFFIGTPHGGSKLAEFHAPFRNTLAFLRHPLDLDNPKCNGEASVDLIPESKLLKQLANAKRNGNTRYHVIAGKRALVAADKLPKLRADLARLLQRASLRESEKARILNLVSSLQEIIHAKGDGAVSLDSACLPEVTTKETFDLDHFDLLCREPVMRHILDTLTRLEKEQRP